MQVEIANIAHAAHVYPPAISRRPRRFALTTRRLLALTAISAVAFSGIRSGDQPGWHVTLPSGLRAGVCRDDADGLTMMADGKPGGHRWRAGVWSRPGRAGNWMWAGAETKDGRVVVWTGGGGVVVW